VSECLDFQKAHLVCSDAVPDFMGDRFVDHMRTVDLYKEVLRFCAKNLEPGGTLLMKIIQGPAEKELSEFATHLFKSLQRVKPSASRNVSSETYYLCHGFMQSQTTEAVRFREIKDQLELHEDNPTAQNDIYKVLLDEQTADLKKHVEEIHRSGMEIPEKIKDFLQTSPLAKSYASQVELENRMSAREKAKARQKHEDVKDKEFFERTGIRDESADWKAQNLVTKFKYDMV